MVDYTIDAFDAETWTGLISAYDGVSLMQSWEYAAAKTAGGGWRAERGTFTENGSLVGVVQVMVHPLPWIGGGLAWINRGPLWQNRSGDGADRFAALLAALRRHYVEDRGLYLRIAPADRDGTGIPDAAAGFRLAATAGWASALLDLSTETTVLRRGLRRRWRNHLNQAERAGIGVKAGTESAHFDSFLDEYRSFVEARGFRTSVTSTLLADLQTKLPPERKMICYRGVYGDKALGSILIARYGNCAEYLAGAILEAGRATSVSQLLLWRAICDMQAAGVGRFDLGGMDPDLTPKGIYSFKQGVGGTAYRLAPEIEALDGSVRARLVRWRVNRARRSETKAAG